MMTRRTAGGITIDICESRHGIWFDGGELWTFAQAQRGKAPSGNASREGDGTWDEASGWGAGGWLAVITDFVGEIVLGAFFHSGRS